MGLITQYILKTSLMAQVILIALLILSVISWAIIFEKIVLFYKVRRQSKRFLYLFYHYDSFRNLVENNKIGSNSPYFRLFENVYSELNLIEAPSASDSGLNLEKTVFREMQSKINAVMEKTITVELAKLDQYMVFLSTTVSVSPFLGLFGTVWGIMYAFMGMGMKGSADITTVGPGIAEALITTLLGLAVAIPALFAYNIFTGNIRRIERDLNLFSADLPLQITLKR